MWWLYALIGSFFLSAYVYCNQVFKFSAPILMIYRGLGVAFLLLPFSIVIWPAFSVWFFVLAAINGLFIGYIDNRYFRSSKVFGAEATGVIQPLSLAVTFVFWYIFKPSKIFEIIDNPLHFILVVLCLGGVLYSVIALKQAKASKKALFYLLPCVIIGGVLDTNNKIIMDLGESDRIVAVYFYTMISALFCGLYSIKGYAKYKKKTGSALKISNLKKGFLVMFFIIGLVVFKGYAIGLAPNPAYVVAITYLSPIWTVLANNLYNMFTKKKVRGRINLKIMALLLVSIITLVLINR